jgi:hypothetical protein
LKENPDVLAEIDAKVRAKVAELSGDVTPVVAEPAAAIEE